MLPLVTTMPLGSAAFSALTVGGVKCGTKICELFQYCSEIHFECDDCMPICDENGHNFDVETCKSKCQGMIPLHWFVYVKLNVSLPTRKCNFCTLLQTFSVSFVFADYLHDRSFVKLSDYAGKLFVKLLTKFR